MRERRVIPRSVRGQLPRRIHLSTIDQVSPRIYQQRVLCFDLQPGLEPSRLFDLLCLSVEHALEGFPQVGGEVVLEDASRQSLAIDLSENTGVVCRLVNYTEPQHQEEWTYGTFEDLRAKRFPVAEIPRQLLAPLVSPTPSKDGSPPCCYMQANVVPGNGLLLAYAMHHSVSDLLGYKLFLDALATAFESLSTDSQAPASLELPSAALDRTLLKGRASVCVAKEGDFPDILLEPPAATPPEDQGAAQKTERITTTAIWRVTSTALRELKRCIAVASSTQLKAPSTVKTLFAFLWLHAWHARDLQVRGYESSQLLMAYNIRPACDFLDPHYLGNAAFIVRSRVGSGVVNDPPTFSDLASAIDTITKNLDDQRHKDVRAQLDYLETATSYSSVQYQQDYSFGPDLFITDQTALDAYDTDWGPLLGHGMVSLRLHAGIQEGMCFILSPFDEDVEFVTVLEKAATMKLEADESFTSWAKMQTSTDTAVW